MYNDKGNELFLTKTTTTLMKDYKEMCREVFRFCKSCRYKLVEMVKLVQDFDKLCDQLRDYVNELSVKDFAREALEEVVTDLIANYYDDLSYLGFSELVVRKR